MELPAASGKPRAFGASSFRMSTHPTIDASRATWNWPAAPSARPYSCWPGSAWCATISTPSFPPPPSCHPNRPLLLPTLSQNPVISLRLPRLKVRAKILNWKNQHLLTKTSRRRWRSSMPTPGCSPARGAVVATYRKVGQRSYGPYYRLAYRTEGQQRSVYIGRNSQQADAVRTALSALQVPWRRLRELDRCERDARRCLRLAKLQALPSLRLVGLRFHGSEIRGWRGNLLFRTTAWRPPSQAPIASPDTASARFIEIDPAGSRNRPGHQTPHPTIRQLARPPSSQLGMKPLPVLPYVIPAVTTHRDTQIAGL